MGLAALLVRDRKLMTALGAARCKDAASVLCGHTRPESMLICTLAAARLKCTLHGRKSLNPCYERG